MRDDKIYTHAPNTLLEVQIEPERRQDHDTIKFTWLSVDDNRAEAIKKSHPSENTILKNAWQMREYYWKDYLNLLSFSKPFFLLETQIFC